MITGNAKFIKPKKKVGKLVSQAHFTMISIRFYNNNVASESNVKEQFQMK